MVECRSALKANVGGTVKLAVVRQAVLLALVVAALPGCALTGESAARRRWRDMVVEPGPAEHAPVPSEPAPPSEEEVAIQKKPLLGLLDCQRLALLRSERLRAQAERVHQADLNEIGAVTNLLPRATYNFQYFRQEAKAASALFPNENRTHKFVLSQPLFRGFGEWFAIAAAGDAIEAQESRMRGARLDVALACGRAFYAVTALERSVETLARSLELEDARLAEVKARETAGLARKTERLFIETDRARTEAELARSKRHLEAARAELAYFTGAPAAELDGSDAAPRRPDALERFVERARDRPDIAALAHDVERARHEIWVARASFLPTADASAQGFAYREGLFERVRWDVTLGVNWPFFESGRSVAAMRLAESRARETERLYADARRRAETEIATAYQAFLASLDQIPALETRVRSAEENVKLLDAEYKAGIATNLEAVDAENTRRQAHLDLARELFEAHRLELELRAASGDDTLAPSAYPPSRNDAPAPPK